MHWPELNLGPLGLESNVLTITPPSHPLRHTVFYKYSECLVTYGKLWNITWSFSPKLIFAVDGSPIHQRDTNNKLDTNFLILSLATAATKRCFLVCRSVFQGTSSKICLVFTTCTHNESSVQECIHTASLINLLQLPQIYRSQCPHSCGITEW